MMSKVNRIKVASLNLWVRVNSVDLMMIPANLLLMRPIIKKKKENTQEKVSRKHRGKKKKRLGHSYLFFLLSI